MRVLWTRPASHDLEAIGDYIAETSPPAATRTKRLIVERVRQLARHPHLGRPGRASNTRELVVPGSPYIVVYQVADDRIEIVAVFHGAREWPESF
jgi:toxin ParE1/3/4